MDVFKPMLFTSLKGYNKQQLVKDIVSGIIVAIIALPLSIALALASGVGPEYGIYTAIVGGFLISFFGGSCVQIAGPTAAFATIVAGIVAEAGTDGLAAATVMAGVILIIMGLLRLGKLIKYIPYSITTGFTAGIAVTILVGQFKDFFGITYADGMSPIETTEKLKCFFECFGTVNIWAVVVGIVSLAVMIGWQYINKTIPGSLIAVILGIVMVKLFNMNVNTIGDLYTITNALPSFRMPVFSLELVKDMLPNAFTIAVLAGIESLLSCVVADGMTGTQHRSNTELIAQGIGNLGSALFGGIPATGAIARTAANIKSGGRTPVAGIVHAITLLLILVVLMPYAAWIPMPTIAAILFIVAYNMCQIKPFTKILKTAPKSDIAVLLITFVLTVVFDLVVAIAAGIAASCILFVVRMSKESAVAEERSQDASIKTYRLSGSVFFGSSDNLNVITNVDENVEKVVLDMHAVPAVDATALKAFEGAFDSLKANGVTLEVIGLSGQPLRMMKKAGFDKKIGI